MSDMKDFDTNHWLHDTYGLDDDDCLSAGQVAELAEMLARDVQKSTRERDIEEIKEYLQGQFLDENGKDPEGIEEYERDCKMVNGILEAIIKALRKL